MTGSSFRRWFFAVFTVMMLTMVPGASVAHAHAGPVITDSAQLRVKMLGWVNDARVNAHSSVLTTERLATNMAKRHSLAMAACHCLFHSSHLEDVLAGTPHTTYGENVGVGPTARSIFRAYMASPTHRANILNPSFRHIGVGLVRHGDVWWNTLIFYG